MTGSSYLHTVEHVLNCLKWIIAAESILQKLQKVQQGLLEEQKACDSLKKRYATAMAEQRRCYSLLKDFQVILVFFIL